MKSVILILSVLILLATPVLAQSDWDRAQDRDLREMFLTLDRLQGELKDLAQKIAEMKIPEMRKQIEDLEKVKMYLNNRGTRK